MMWNDKIFGVLDDGDKVIIPDELKDDIDNDVVKFEIKNNKVFLILLIFFLF